MSVESIVVVTNVVSWISSLLIFRYFIQSEMLNAKLLTPASREFKDVADTVRSLAHIVRVQHELSNESNAQIAVLNEASLAKPKKASAKKGISKALVGHSNGGPLKDNKNSRVKQKAKKGQVSHLDGAKNANKAGK